MEAADYLSLYDHLVIRGVEESYRLAELSRAVLEGWTQGGLT
jgi:hypothetical protein